MQHIGGVSRRLSRISARSVVTVRHRPALSQSRNRRRIEVQFPYSFGTKRHGPPVRMRQRIPFTVSRRTSGAVLPDDRDRRTMGMSASHSRSVKSPRCIDWWSSRQLTDAPLRPLRAQPRRVFPTGRVVGNEGSREGCVQIHCVDRRGVAQTPGRDPGRLRRRYRP